MNAHHPKILSASDFGRVAVLYGGDSAEREISLMSGAAVHQALKERGISAKLVDAVDDFETTLRKGGFDRVWIALHGRGGEDGTVQRMLEASGLPYTGSGPQGSALAMNKLATKETLQACGLPTAPWRQVSSAAELADAASDIGLPVFVKPALEGSSIGMSRVDDMAKTTEAWSTASQSNSPVMVEAAISGNEYTAAILNGVALPLIRIDAQNTFYDYQAKYFSDQTQYHCPCGLPAEREAEFAAMALKAFAAVGCDGWGRVDFMLDAHGSPLILEINTVPGMTSHSLVPMAAEHAGIDFGGLVWRILETSFDKSAAEGAGHVA